MNDTSNNERNEQVVKVMAVIGFVVLICLLAWLAVQVVRLLPTAFSSLANIFESNQREYAENTDTENEVIVVVNEDGEETPAEEENEEETVATTTTPVATSTAATSTPTNPTPVQYRTVTTYKYPVSDPNGKVDLAATFIGVGSVNSAGRFTLGELSTDGQGAMQFVVKNVGTKTSGTWSFEVTMPNGSKMNSKTQAALKPAESSTLTLVFGMNDERPHDVSATIVTTGDVNLANNGFGAKLVQR